MFEIEQQPHIASNGLSLKSFTDKSPRMDPSKPTEVTLGIVNSGKPAFGCQVRLGGKFDHPTESLDYAAANLFPAVIDFGTDAGASIPLGVTPSSNLLPASGDVRLYLYWRVDCAKTLTQNRPYHSQLCAFFPISNTGEVVDFVHGCWESVSRSQPVTGRCGSGGPFKPSLA
jgi:hypothetical protein